MCRKLNRDATSNLHVDLLTDPIKYTLVSESVDRMSAKFILVIKNASISGHADESLSGTYSCSISNSYGEANFEFKILKNCKHKIHFF